MSCPTLLGRVQKETGNLSLVLGVTPIVREVLVREERRGTGGGRNGSRRQ